VAVGLEDVEDLAGIFGGVHAGSKGVCGCETVEGKRGHGCLLGLPKVMAPNTTFISVFGELAMADRAYGDIS
jgi:hypothetical protein